MDRKQPVSRRRAAALAAALFAITLNFLQPLALAALLRDGGPMAAASIWGAFCMPAGAQDDAQSHGQDQGQGQAPATAEVHECCLGLAHAPAIAEPPTAFIRVEPGAAAERIAAANDIPSPVGIRDGPSQPRAPPFPV
jgi:hypothetical protein